MISQGCVAAYQQEMTGLHAVQLVDILEKLAARIILQQILTLFVLVGFLGDCWVNAVMLP